MMAYGHAYETLFSSKTLKLALTKSVFFENSEVNAYEDSFLRKLLGGSQ